MNFVYIVVFFDLNHLKVAIKFLTFYVSKVKFATSIEIYYT